MRPSLLVAIGIVIGIVGAMTIWWLRQSDDLRIEVQSVAAVVKDGTPKTTQASANIAPIILATEKIENPGFPMVVTLAAGVQANINMGRYVPPAPYLSSTGRLIDIIDVLQEKAKEGDAVAARTLYRGVNNCKKITGDEPSVDVALRVLQSEGYYLFDGQKIQARTVNEQVAFESILEDSYHECENIGDQYDSAMDGWLKIAADGGDLLGMRDYLWSVEESSPAYTSMLEKLWMLGYTDALMRYATEYSRLGSPKRDMTRSYAYYLALVKLKEEVWNSSGNEQRMATRVAAMRGRLQERSTYLSSSEQEDAERLAASILEGNPNCCLSIWSPR